MAADKQPSACVTCGVPVPFPGAPCMECTAITQNAGEAGWRPRLPERRPLLPGDVLEGKWRLEELLGAGGMGQVYRARDLALERTVAIKLLHEALSEDAQSVARFEREARAMARLEHAHITPIHAVGKEAGRPFIVMKHLEGMSLARYLRSVPGPLPVPEVLALARQLCAGLAFIHGQGCVHRDIKPGNIFVSPSGHATLLDFGILWEHRGAESTGSGVRLGTPSFMAPEQARGEPVDGRADLYSLGLVLLEALTGLPPSRTCRLLGEGPQGVVRALREQAPWLSAPLTEVLVRATALNPEQRYAGALALLESLETAAQGAAPESVPDVAAKAESTPPAVPPANSRDTRARGMPVAIAAGAGAGALILLAVLAPWRTGEPPAAPVTAAPSTALASTHAPASPAPKLETVPPTLEAVPPAPSPPAAAEPPATRKPAPPARTAPRAPAETSVEGNARRKVVKGQGELRVVTLHKGRTIWANVSVDGKHHGATPLSLDLPEGRHAVRVERSGFAPEVRQVDVSPGTKAVVRIELHE